MKRSYLLLISLILSCAFILSVFVACGNGNEETTQPSCSESEEPSETLSDSESKSDESGDETESGDENGDDTDAPSSISDIPYGEVIENAYGLANKVQAYFTDERSRFTVYNQEMFLEYALGSDGKQLVASLKNSKGRLYFENTMDVFVRMNDGKTYYSSDSNMNATANLYREGFYYYEARFEEQVFGGEPTFTGIEKNVSPKTNDCTGMTFSQENGLSKYTVNDAADPRMIFRGVSCETAESHYLQITLKVDSPNKNQATFDIYLKAGSHTKFSEEQSVSFKVKADGEMHTYLAPICLVSDYTGKLSGLRLDTEGLNVGDSVTVESLKLLQAEIDSVPFAVSMSRSFLVYSDKMHHYAQIAATEKTENVAAVGMLTRIASDSVAKIIVKDAKEIHDSLDGVDWTSVECVGFDIKDAGIFGYIMPDCSAGGEIRVTLGEDGIYVIEQTRAPEHNTLLPSEAGTSNANDFYFGQRIYTDESHNFDTLLSETYNERNPLTQENIVVTNGEDSKASLIGYDAVRGIYMIEMEYPQGSFNGPFYYFPNRHFSANISITGDDRDRSIYVMSYCANGTLECAAILDGGNVMLPMPIEVIKNFSEENGERNLYNIDDSEYSEAIVPLFVKAKEAKEYKLLNLYQNWGNFPLKQISAIQYSSPYYHLSTGVTETNCITPWFFPRKNNHLKYSTLPDFRAASSPYWKSQPQHTNSGLHQWLIYTDADGVFVTTENIKNTIDSFGPTYADIKMDCISTDGKIAVSYTHMEMPQTDENRTYYTMEYTVLEDVSFEDFRNDFQFYSMERGNDATGLYKEIGYLNENNESAYAMANLENGNATAYVLGDRYPYFTYYNMGGAYDKENNPTGYSNENGYCNLAFLVSDYEFVIGGEKLTPRFVVTEKDNVLKLSLNLEKVELKAGDTFRISAILLPWGSQEMEESYATLKDKNVLEVRNNSIIRGLTAKAVADCTVIESDFVPKIRSTNGERAEFTVSGGTDNTAIRVYGFNKRTVPKVYEKVGGKLFEIELSSENNPDIKGYRYSYDGYCVYYDMDGTFSYSFVVEMKRGKERTFVIDASEEVTELPIFEREDERSFDAEEINSIFYDLATTNRIELSEDNSYVSIYGNGKDAEKYKYIFDSSTGGVSGRYIVLEYRLPETNTTSFKCFEFYTSSTNAHASADDVGTIGGEMIKNDGLWHMVVVDASTYKTVELNDEGSCQLNFLRFDFFNNTIDRESRVDIAHIGVYDTIEDICNIAEGYETLDYLESTDGSVAGTIDVATCEVTVDSVTDAADDPSGGTVLNVFWGADRLYIKATDTATARKIGQVDYHKDEGYISCYPQNTEYNESYIKDLWLGDETVATGQYLMFKYRMPVQDIGTFELYTSTLAASTKEDPKGYVSLKSHGELNLRDNEWHIVIIDLSKTVPTFTPAEDGKYYAKHLRFDWFNSVVPSVTDYRTDLAYITFFDDFEKAVSFFDSAVDEVSFYDGSTVTVLDPKTDSLPS